MNAATLQFLTPEIALIAAAVVIFLGGAFSTARGAWRWLAGGAMALAAASLANEPALAGVVGTLIADPLALYFRWLALAIGAVLLLLASRPFAREGTSEYLGSLLLIVAGMMLVGVADDLILLFVALELISIPTYLMLYLGRIDAESQESTIKYFFLSILSSSILLFGFSFLYGVGGSTDLSAIRAMLADPASLPAGFPMLARLALALIFAGLCFKIAAVPFHFYAPDVYQGTTHPNAALLSTAPKAAGLFVIYRVLVLVMPDMSPYSWQMALWASVLTMSLGNVMALWQDNLRRLLAYSSIAHAGYLLIGVAAALAAGDEPGAWNGAAAAAFYLVTYAAATLGAFAVLEYLGRADRRIDGVEELAGLGRTRPLPAVLLALCMFSLAGVPPMAGFWGKLLVFGSALYVDSGVKTTDQWFVGLAIVGVLNAAVAAAYYLRIVAVMYFRTPLATPRAEGGPGAWWAAVLSALLVVGIGLYPGPLVQATNEAVQTPYSAQPKSDEPEEKPPSQSAPSPGMAERSRISTGNRSKKLFWLETVIGNKFYAVATSPCPTP